MCAFCRPSCRRRGLRGCPMMMSVRLVLRALHSLLNVAAEPVIVIVAALRAFTRLTLRREAARHAPALRAGLADRARALDHFVLFVHTHRDVADDLIADAQTAIDFLHELAGTRDVLEHIRAFLVRANFVGQLPASPVVGFLELARKSSDNLLHLGVEIGDLLLARVRCDDVDELVLPDLALTLTHLRSPSGSPRVDLSTLRAEDLAPESHA